ncbi:MAG: zinc transporter ZntB [Gammaproteobacteria bacterium]|nr:zinc transporter ZntB [Gammaproteobacteria bacterium]
MTNGQNKADETGLICAYELDGQGGGRSMAWQDIDTSSSPGRTRWIHLDFRAPHACEWIRKDSGIDSFVADALLDDDSRPRVVEHGDGLLIILRGVNTNPGAEPEDMVSIRIWLEEGRIISTRRRRLLSIQAIRDDIAAGVGPRSSADFVVNLVNKLGDRIDPVIESLDEAIEDAEAEFNDGATGSYRGEFSSLRRQAVRIRRFLAPQREGLSRLAKQKIGLLPEDKIFELREEADRVTRYLEDLDLIRERAMVAQEELLAKMAQEQNRRMYILAIVAALFLPLSFLTGLMGMNVAGLPGTEDPLSFAIVSLIMGAAGAGILLAFRLQKWL